MSKVPFNPLITVNNSDFRALFYVGGLALSMLYAGVFIAYLMLVVMRTQFLYGIYRWDGGPGPLIDDRYSYAWWFLMLNNLRVLALPGLIWVFQNLSVRVKALMVYAMFVLLSVLDFVLLMVWLIMQCFFCNNGIFRNGLCDTVDTTAYCGAFWKDQPDLCAPGADPPLVAQCDLTTNPAYINLIYFTLGFFALDIIIALYLWIIRKITYSMALSARMYGYSY